MTVVSLAAAREERAPHWQGLVHCIGCGHEWQGVAPIGTMRLDCPSCELPKGLPKYPFGGDGTDSILHCKCGCEAMNAYQRDGLTYVMCMACGTDQTHAFFGSD